MTQSLSLRVALTLFLVIAVVDESRSETVDVKYRGPVDLTPFKCSPIDRSSFIRRVCYDAAHSYMIVKLNETYYHYCDIDDATVEALKAASSMGRFFNATIKGHFDCRTGTVPSY
jgi:KTSC domain